jgi:UDP-N-acetyl-D-mannosaminuronic acid dehydrogenase
LPEKKLEIERKAPMLRSAGNGKPVLTVVGLGYIGLPTATLFASAGFKVYGYEKNHGIVDSLMAGKPHIHFQEADLRGLVQSVLQSGDLVPTREMQPSDVFIICVPTPSKPGGHGKVADLAFVRSAAEEVATVLKKGNTVILESTVPPKTTEQVMGKILAKGSGLVLHQDFQVAHCPERVIPGRILQELRHNDRIIGARTPEVAKGVKALYETIVTGGKVHTTGLVTAEMCKLVENTYRDVNIAFANELSLVCDDAGIDVHELISLANRHPRVNILTPGPGVGGHCIAVDPWFIAEAFPERTPLVQAARHVNDAKPAWVVEKVKANIREGWGDKNVKVGILGLAYKADVDDVRESPALQIARLLKDSGLNVLACEPNVHQGSIDGFENHGLAEILDEANYLVLAVPHRQFLDVRETLMGKPFFDAAGVLR